MAKNLFLVFDQSTMWSLNWNEGLNQPELEKRSHIEIQSHMSWVISPHRFHFYSYSRSRRRQLLFSHPRHLITFSAAEWKECIFGAVAISSWFQSPAERLDDWICIWCFICETLLRALPLNQNTRGSFRELTSLGEFCVGGLKLAGALGTGAVGMEISGKSWRFLQPLLFQCIPEVAGLLRVFREGEKDELRDISETSAFGDAAAKKAIELCVTRALLFWRGSAEHNLSYSDQRPTNDVFQN